MKPSTLIQSGSLIVLREPGPCGFCRRASYFFVTLNGSTRCAACAGSGS